MNIQDVAFSVPTANVTIVTTAETVVVSSGPAKLGFDTGRMFIIAWWEVTTGTNTADVTAALVRGTAATGTDVLEKNAVTIVAAAASTERNIVVGTDTQSGVSSVEYSLTLTMGSASGNSTVLQAGIIVFVF